MRIHNTSDDDMPSEVQVRLNNALKDIVDVSQAIQVSEAYVKKLKATLLEDFDHMGIVSGDMVISPSVGVEVRVSRRSTRRLNKQSLIDMGVSRDLVAAAEIESTSAPFLTFKGIREASE